MSEAYVEEECEVVGMDVFKVELGNNNLCEDPIPEKSVDNEDLIESRVPHKSVDNEDLLESRVPHKGVDNEDLLEGRVPHKFQETLSASHKEGEADEVTREVIHAVENDDLTKHIDDTEIVIEKPKIVNIYNEVYANLTDLKSQVEWNISDAKTGEEILDEAKEAIAEARNQQNSDVPKENNSEDITQEVFDKEDVGIETKDTFVNDQMLLTLLRICSRT